MTNNYLGMAESSYTRPCAPWANRALSLRDLFSSIVLVYGNSTVYREGLYSATLTSQLFSLSFQYDGRVLLVSITLHNIITSKIATFGLQQELKVVLANTIHRRRAMCVLVRASRRDA